jgi:hypothetical protein
MNESDSSTTNRLRRRSFVEHVEVGGSFHSSTSSSTTTTTDAVFAAGVEYPSTSTTSSTSLSSKWLLEHIKNVFQYQIHRIRHRLYVENHSHGNTSPSVEIQWRYPIGWITFGYVSLICLQLICFMYFQIDLKHLQVEECIYQTPLLLSSTTNPNSIITNEMIGLKKESFISLQRRFAQLTHRRPRLLVSEESESEVCMQIFSSTIEEGNQLQWFLPHSQVFLFPNQQEQRTSKFQIYLFTQQQQQQQQKVIPPIHDEDDEQTVQSVLIYIDGGGDDDDDDDSEFWQKQLQHSIGSFPSFIFVKNQFMLNKLWHFRQDQFVRRNQRQEYNNKKDDDNDDWLKYSSTFSIFYLKTSVPDIYDRLIEKEWHSFLHIVQVQSTMNPPNPLKYTFELLQVWLQHPEWPTLFIRFASSTSSTSSTTSSCQSIVLFLQEQQGEGPLPFSSSSSVPSSSSRKHHHQNIDITCDPSENTPSRLIHLKNQMGIHLFPVSPIETNIFLQEQIIFQSLSTGAIALTFHSPLMKEWVPDGTGLRIDQQENQMEQGIAHLLALPVHVKVAMGRMARKQYLAWRTHYLTALAALDEAICGREEIDFTPLQAFLY